MASKWRQYIRAAFSARPWGMLVPPNWLGLAAFGLLGLLSPGFWLLGAGLELGYLYVLCSNPRFRRVVDAQAGRQDQQAVQQRMEAQVARLDGADRVQYAALEARCRGILAQQRGDVGPDGLAAQGAGLGRLLWIYLRLLLTRQSLRGVLNEAKRYESSGRSLQQRAEQLKERLDKEQLSEDLRKSLMGQLEIIQQRQESQKQAAAKLSFLEAELTRIQEQVELIREQAVLTPDAQAVSERIDQVAATLGGTTQWIREQQKMYGQVEDLLVEPPPVALSPDQSETPGSVPPPPLGQREKA